MVNELSPKERWGNFVNDWENFILNKEYMKSNTVLTFGGLATVATYDLDYPYENDNVVDVVVYRQGDDKSLDLVMNYLQKNGLNANIIRNEGRMNRNRYAYFHGMHIFSLSGYLEHYLSMKDTLDEADVKFVRQIVRKINLR